MAKITLTVCDVCDADGVESPGRKHTVVIDGRSYKLDLCDEHYGAVIAPLLEILTSAGRKMKATRGPRLVHTTSAAPAPSTLQITCTEPGCTRTFDSEERRNRHIGQGHKRKANATVVAFSA